MSNIWNSVWLVENMHEN